MVVVLQDTFKQDSELRIREIAVFDKNFFDLLLVEIRLASSDLGIVQLLVFDYYFSNLAIE